MRLSCQGLVSRISKTTFWLGFIVVCAMVLPRYFLSFMTILLAFVLLHGAYATSVDDQLQSMSSAGLASLEKTLRSQVDEHDKELAEMKEETDRLKKEQKTVDQEAEQLAGAKQWELDEKARREKELDSAKEDVMAKQESISKMSVQVANLKDQIGALQNRLQLLNHERDTSEKRYRDPSLADVLESRSHRWSNVTRNVYQKTVSEFVPALTDMTETARSYRRQVSKTSKFLELLASLIIYSFIIAASLASYRIYTKVRGKLTIARLLFLGDAFCACFWTVMLICFTILFDDPLFVMKERSPMFFFAFQLIACFSYVNFVLLRVLVLASKMTLGALGETLAVVIVGHHYYVRVWQPAMLDKPFRGTFFYYFCYAWLFSAFAYNRIQEFAPLKQLRGPQLPPYVWLNVLFARFMRRNVPDGDIESTPYRAESGDDEGHEH